MYFGYIYKITNLNLGYRRGKINSQSAPNKGKICINNGVNNKYIYENEIECYLELGWHKGMITRINALDGEGSQALAEEYGDIGRMCFK